MTCYCGKTGRARLYCHSRDCGRSTVELPQPDVEVSSSITETGTKVDVVLSRDGKARSYTSEKLTADGAVADVVGQILSDHRNAEFVRRA